VEELELKILERKLQHWERNVIAERLETALEHTIKIE
jgi:hypothetical protein